MDLYLVRHGDTELGADGLYPDPAHLSELGHAQARALTPVLESINPHALISSGIERADETAAPFVASSGIQPAIVPGFDEIGIGDLRSRDLTVIKEKLFKRPFISDFSEYAGESSSEFARRVLDCLQSHVLDRFDDGQRVAAVIHGGPINVILQWIEHRSFTGTFAGSIETASVTLLRRGPDGLKIVYRSDTSHLTNVS
ncbi:MAG: histidine phosphatase family protein [Dehalococcoidia bacterium]|jgi:probable phosphoglycerate mutase|nr:histidine phosphatase family protein [Dehalococcoidia bacterium]